MERKVCVRCGWEGHRSSQCKQPNPGLFPEVKREEPKKEVDTDQDWYCFLSSLKQVQM
jgi:hypothetical protein